MIYRRGVPIRTAACLLLPWAAALLAGGCAGKGQQELGTLVAKEAPCSTAADCCVVMDPCHGAAYVIESGDFDEARDLSQQAQNEGQCTKCAIPAVALHCTAGQCSGWQVAPDAGGQLDSSHCGEITAASSALTTDVTGESDEARAFGCGVD
jgi:hypothetical protein